MVSAEQVKVLNSKIEKINVNRTKAKTQQEMLQKRLDSELAEYAKQFGVDLKGKSLSQTKALIAKEVKKVVQEVQEEYDLKEKVVFAIESNNYEEAYNLLGIEIEPEEEEVEEEVENEETQKESTENNLEEPTEEDTEGEDLIGGLDVDREETDDFDIDDNDFGFDSDELSEMESNLEKGNSSKAEDDSDLETGNAESEEGNEDMTIEEESEDEELESEEEEDSVEEEDEYIDIWDDFVGEVEEGKTQMETPENTSTGADAFSDLDLQVEDDVDIDDDFGFGEMLKGTKLEID